WPFWSRELAVRNYAEANVQGRWNDKEQHWPDSRHERPKRLRQLVVVILGPSKVRDQHLANRFLIRRPANSPSGECNARMHPTGAAEPSIVNIIPGGPPIQLARSSPLSTDERSRCYSVVTRQSWSA